MTDQQPDQHCPKCGGALARIVYSRDIYPPLAPAQRSPPTGTAYTYECPCGTVFVVNVKNDIRKSGPVN